MMLEDWQEWTTQASGKSQLAIEYKAPPSTAAKEHLEEASSKMHQLRKDIKASAKNAEQQKGGASPQGLDAEPEPGHGTHEGDADRVCRQGRRLVVHGLALRPV